MVALSFVVMGAQVMGDIDLSQKNKWCLPTNRLKAWRVWKFDLSLQRKG